MVDSIHRVVNYHNLSTNTNSAALQPAVCMICCLSFCHTHDQVLIYNGEKLRYRTPSQRLDWLCMQGESFILILAVTLAFLRRRNAGVLWGLFGATINHVVSKLLKRLIKEPRPGAVIAADREIDTNKLGMPSSHAQTLSFLSTYACLGGFVGRFECSATGCWKAVLLLSAAGYMAWLRIREGHHTTAQVLAGSLAGTVFAVAWLFLHDATFIPSF